MVFALKIFLVFIILVAMAVILLGINQLFAGNFTTHSEEAEELRKDVKTGDEIMTRYNAFRQFLGNVSKRR